MKLKLLNMNNFVRGLRPVTSTELKTKSGELHPDGLFSEKIFGIENSLERARVYSYINLNAFIVHPAAYKLLIRIDRRIEKYLNTEETYSLDSNNQLVVDDKGSNGIMEFMKIFPVLNLKAGTDAREKIIKLLKDAAKDGALFIDKLPVIPPDFRPMFTDEDGNITVDAINNLYVSIMRKATQVKTIGTGSALYNLLNFYLQKAVNDHDEYVRAKISKKHGLVRENMLGKRIDFSARGVITPGPQLDVNEVGVPLRMAIELFKPFLIHYILFSKKYPYIKQLADEIKKHDESELSVDTLNRYIKSVRSGDKLPKELYNLFFDACQIVMKDRVVLLKRDPALHAESYRALKPILTHGDTIQLCTLQVGGFNADFDGDQMAIFHPLSQEAQAEAKTRMMRGIGAKNDSSVSFELSKEMIVGLYIMTKEKNNGNSPIAVTPEMLEKAIDPYVRVKYRNHVTTMGRAIYNSAFPPDWPFVDSMVRKGDVNGSIAKVIQKYGDDIAVKVFSKLEKIGFKFATIMGPSLTLDILQMPESLSRIKEKIPGSSPEEAVKLIDAGNKIMKESLKGTTFYDLVDSGSAKGWDQPSQIFVAKGVISDPKGNILPPIEGSFSDGLKPTEYFSAASGARKGMADRALNTADTGYFTRQLVYVLGPVEASHTLNDCKTKRTITIRLTNDIIKRLKLRKFVYGGNIHTFDPSKFKPGDVVSLRSPIFCESEKICHTCYGDLLRVHKSPYIGILSGSMIGERGTQLIMQSFHTGGAATFAIHNVLQEIYDNDPLVSADLKKYIQQDDDKVITLKPCKITIDMSNYKINDNLQINEDHVWCNHLLAKIEYNDVIFNLILDYPVHIKRFDIERTKETLVFNFQSQNIIFEIPQTIIDMKQQVNYVNRLLGGKVVYKDPSHLVNKIMKVYGGKISNLDLVHFEVLLSQVLRDKTKPTLPARLARTWDPIMMNIKNAVFQTGFVNGLAFENVNKAIETGLISDGELEPSILGKLITGELNPKR